MISHCSIKSICAYLAKWKISQEKVINLIKIFWSTCIHLFSKLDCFVELGKKIFNDEMV